MVIVVVVEAAFTVVVFFNILCLSLLVEIFADTAEGYMNILSNGGNGKPGQDGANGRKGSDSLHKV